MNSSFKLEILHIYTTNRYDIDKYQRKWQFNLSGKSNSLLLFFFFLSFFCTSWTNFKGITYVALKILENTIFITIKYQMAVIIIMTHTIHNIHCYSYTYLPSTSYWKCAINSESFQFSASHHFDFLLWIGMNGVWTKMVLGFCFENGNDVWQTMKERTVMSCKLLISFLSAQ